MLGSLAGKWGMWSNCSGSGLYSSKQLQVSQPLCRLLPHNVPPHQCLKLHQPFQCPQSSSCLQNNRTKSSNCGLPYQFRIFQTENNRYLKKRKTCLKLRDKKARQLHGILKYHARGWIMSSVQLPIANISGKPVIQEESDCPPFFHVKRSPTRLWRWDLFTSNLWILEPPSTHFFQITETTTHLQGPPQPQAIAHKLYKWESIV